MFKNVYCIINYRSNPSSDSQLTLISLYPVEYSQELY